MSGFQIDHVHGLWRLRSGGMSDKYRWSFGRIYLLYGQIYYNIIQLLYLRACAHAYSVFKCEYTGSYPTILVSYGPQCAIIRRVLSNCCQPKRCSYSRAGYVYGVLILIYG